MFATTIEQAKALLEAGHLVPAAVLGRIVIEGWLRDEAQRAGVAVPSDAKAATVNDALKKANALSIPKWRLIQAHLDVGNHAAHGKTASFSREDVVRMLDFAETSCV